MLKKGLLILFAVIAICGGLVGWFWSIAGSKYAGEKVRIFIPSKSDAQQVEDTLKSSLGDYGAKVAKLWRWQKGQQASGSYVITPGTTALQASRIILQGRQTPVKVILNNVRLMTDLADKVCASLEIKPEDFLAVCDTFLLSSGYKREEFPAAFLPDSYEFYWNASAPTVVKRLVSERDKFWNVERRAQAAALGLTPNQVATLASIVDEESAKADEKPKIARLYLNRLQKGMLLQADPTVKYAVGDFSLRRILGQHLQVVSPYNTYKNKGLPPGPIRVPAKQTIDGVLNAPKHDYLYMCAKEDFSGYHNFAQEYATHMQNARRYQAELNKRGIN